MGKFRVVDYSLVQHKLTVIREKNYGTKIFREVINEVAILMAYEVSRDMPLKGTVIGIPMGKSTQKVPSGKKAVIIPILHAGTGATDGTSELIPAAKARHVGPYRDEETLQPHEYFVKLFGDIASRQSFVADSMSATGGSVIVAIDSLKERGTSNIKLVCLAAVPEGVRASREVHLDVGIYTAALDERLNEDSYIVPSLGDAGDRLFETK